MRTKWFGLFSGLLFLSALHAIDGENPALLKIRKNTVSVMGEKVAVHPKAELVYFSGGRVYYDLKGASAEDLEGLAGELKKLYEGKKMAGKKVPHFSNSEPAPDTWNAEACDREKGGPVLQINMNRDERVVSFSFQKTCGRPEM